VHTCAICYVLLLLLLHVSGACCVLDVEAASAHWRRLLKVLHCCCLLLSPCHIVHPHAWFAAREVKLHRPDNLEWAVFKCNFAHVCILLWRCGAVQLKTKIKEWQQLCGTDGGCCRVFACCLGCGLHQL
jgi:hypothetical protein